MAQHIVTSEGGRQSIQSIERVLGTNSADTFIAGAIEHKIDSLGKTTVEVFRGNGGNDTITGVANSDPKWGNDIDYVTGADYSNNTSLQAINANLHTGLVNDGLGGTDTLTWVSMVYGGAGNDTFTGGSLTRGSNGMFWELFRGNGGDDTMDGANGYSDGGDASSDRADWHDAIRFHQAEHHAARSRRWFANEKRVLHEIFYGHGLFLVARPASGGNGDKPVHIEGDIDKFRVDCWFADDSHVNLTIHQTPEGFLRGGDGNLE
jgi:hypothetical protein